MDDVILGSDSFGVANIDRGALAFGPQDAAPVQPQGGVQRDVNRDGFDDLVVSFRIPEVGVAALDDSVCLGGISLDGTAFEGCDAVHLLGVR